MHNLHFTPKTVKFNVNFHKLEKWMTQGLLTSRITKNKLSTLASKIPSALNKQNFVNYRNTYNNLIRAAKKLQKNCTFLEPFSPIQKT